MVRGDFTTDRTWVTQGGKSVRLDQIVHVTVGERGMGYRTTAEPEAFFLEFGAPKVATMASYYMTREEAERDALRIRIAVDRALHGDRRDDESKVRAALDAAAERARNQEHLYPD